MKLEALIFDLDGTLVDSAPGIAAALRQAILRHRPEAGADLNDLPARIGPPVGAILHDLLPAVDTHELAAIEATYRGIYDGGGWRETRLYPGARQALDWAGAQGIACFLVTYKPALPTGCILEALHLRDCFQKVVTPDSRQPDFGSKAEMVAHLLEDYNLSPAQVLLVGDTGDDSRAAAQCGLAFVAAAYGYGDLNALPTPPLGVLAHPGELPRILAGGSLDE